MACRRFLSRFVTEFYNFEPIVKSALTKSFGVAIFVFALLPMVVVFGNLQKYYERLLKNESIKSHNHKMAAVGEMATGASHEINNPLAIIQGRLFMIRKKLIKSSVNYNDQLEYISNAESSIRRVAAIVKGLSSFSHYYTTEEVETVDLDDVIFDISMKYKEAFENANIKFEFEKSSDGFVVSARKKQVFGALSSLVDNAISAMEDTEVKIIRIEIAFSDMGVQISVTDTGAGISPDIRSQIDRPFFTTKGEGVGLGLSLAIEVIKAHNGVLQLDENNEDTKFDIDLPLSA